MGIPMGTVTEIIADMLGKDIPNAINLPRPFLEEVARDIVLSLQSDGLVVVPLKATDEMIDAAAKGVLADGLRWAWEIMILASPHRIGNDEYWDNLLKMHSDETDNEA